MFSGGTVKKFIGLKHFAIQKKLAQNENNPASKHYQGAFFRKTLTAYGGGPYHIKTSPFTGFFMIVTSVMKELNTPLNNTYCGNTCTKSQIIPLEQNL